MVGNASIPSPAATAVALRFLADLQAGKRPLIEAALDAVPTSDWSALLQSLLIAEVNHRRSRGESPVAREYLPRFPAHMAIVREVLPDVAPASQSAKTVPIAAPAPTVAPAPNVQPQTAPIPMAIVLTPAFEDFEPAPDSGPARRRRRSRRLQWLGGTAAVLIIAGIVMFIAIRRGPTQEKPGPAPPAEGAVAANPKGKIKAPYEPTPEPADVARELAEWLRSIGGSGTLALESGGQRPFNPIIPLPKTRFSITGIVLPIEASSQWTGTDLARVRGHDKLTSLELHHPSALTDAALDPLVGLPLRVLELYGENVSVSGQTVSRFPELTTLALLSAPNISDADLAAISKLSKLNSLSIDTAKTTPAGLGALKSTPLRTLVLGEQVILTPDHVRMLLRLPLEVVESSRGMTDDVVLELAVFPNLKFFRARQTTITDDGLKFARGLGKLEELQITGSSITGTGFEHLLERDRLRVLDLTGCKVDDDALVKLLALPALRELRLAGSSISDQGVVLLAQLDGLQVLDLSGTQVTDSALATLKKHRTLKSLILNGTRVTPNGVIDFERATPNCKVVFGKK